MPHRRGHVLAVLDQALYAGTHFVVHVLLARWMSPVDYGAFALVFTSFQLAVVVYNGLVVEPLLVHGPARFRGSWERYLGCVTVAHWRLVLATTAAGGLALVLRYMLSDAVTVWPALVLPVAMALLLGVLLFRRAALAMFQPGTAVLVSGSYLVTALTSLFLFRNAVAENSWAAWIPLGLGGLATAVVARAILPTDTGFSHRRWRSTLVRHWGYGKWVVAAGFLGFLANGLNPYLLAGFRDLSELGSYRAVLNVALPGLQTCAALSIQAIPSFATARDSGLGLRFRRYLLGFTALFAAYAVVLTVAGEVLLSLIYGDHGFQYNRTTIVLAALTPLAYVPVGIGGALLRGLLRSRDITAGSAVVGTVAVAGGVPLVIVWGVNGAMAATALAYAAGGGYVMWRTVIALCWASEQR
jgi:O-antigen/teichoic acid export membrane protein